MNFALVPNVRCSSKDAGKAEPFYYAPVNLGFQPIKLLALEPFEVEYQCCPDSIEQQVCDSLRGDTCLHLAASTLTSRTLLPQFVKILSAVEPGGAILSVCIISLTGIPSVCAVRLDAFQKRPIIRGKRIISVPHRIKSVKRNLPAGTYAFRCA